MKKLFFLTLAASFVSTITFEQSELDFYKKIYKTADSLIAIGQISTIDTISVYSKAKEQDEKHPSGFFEVSGNLLKLSNYNEAAFIYYLGILRYRYYNSANPEYVPSADGALLGSMKYIYDEPINMYLKTDVDNFIFILKLAISYYSNNDFAFFSKDKNIELFNAQMKSYKDLIVELETNKATYIEQWSTERKTMEEYIDKAIEEQKNIDTEKEKNNAQKKKKQNKI